MARFLEIFRGAIRALKLIRDGGDPRLISDSDQPLEKTRRRRLLALKNVSTGYTPPVKRATKTKKGPTESRNVDFPSLTPPSSSQAHPTHSSRSTLAPCVSSSQGRPIGQKDSDFWDEAAGPNPPTASPVIMAKDIIANASQSG